MKIEPITPHALQIETESKAEIVILRELIEKKFTLHAETTAEGEDFLRFYLQRNYDEQEKEINH